MSSADNNGNAMNTSRRPLTTLSVGNFKAFGDTQSLPLKPITLIYGPNSAGKSSLVQALALAHEAEFGQSASDRPLLDVHQTRLGGSAIDLGGFRQYVHRGEARRRVAWGVELDIAAIRAAGADELADAFPGIARLNLNIALGIEVDDQERPKLGAEPRIEEIEIKADGDELMRMSRRPSSERDELAADRFRLDRLATEHRVFTRFLEEALLEQEVPERTPAEYAADLDEAIKALIRDLIIRTERFLPTDAIVTLEASRGVVRPTTALYTTLQRRLPMLLTMMITGVANIVKGELKTVRYLGPLRSLPPRHLAFTEQADANRVAGGAWAWDEVRRDDDVRAAVNVWLGSAKLKTPYQLEVRSLVSIEQVQRIVEDELLNDQYGEIDETDRVSAWQGSVSETDGSGVAARLTEAIARTGVERFRELVLLDQRRNTVVTHRDVGVGISQVLPVLVMCYGSRGAILAMEQPEIHLHPGLQAELGDVFIDAALSGRGNTLIIETHSEHVLLRIMRRIREERAKPGNGATPITAEDVAVLYVEPYERRSVVRKMPLTANGDLAKSWPGGFFEEGLREQFDDA